MSRRKGTSAAAIVSLRSGWLACRWTSSTSSPRRSAGRPRYADTIGVRTFENRKIFTGTLTELIDQVGEFIRQYLVVGGEIIGFKRVDLPEYPFEALREAVALQMPANCGASSLSRSCTTGSSVAAR